MGQLKQCFHLYVTTKRDCILLRYLHKLSDDTKLRLYFTKVRGLPKLAAPSALQYGPYTLCFP